MRHHEEKSSSSSSSLSIQAHLSTLKVAEVESAQPPHEAFFLVFAYLHLFELVSLSKVCKSFREAINNDVLLWLDIVVEPPLGLRFNDDVLFKYSSKAQGRLRSLVLINCEIVTDVGLHKVIENNPHIEKLYIPSCTQLTPDGIISTMKKLTEHGNKLKFIKLENIGNITKEHLEVLYSCLGINPEEQNYSRVYVDHGRFPVLGETPSSAIDIEVCPKCRDVKLVFGCTRESCRSRNIERPLAACKGCLLCIPRCEGCGGCVDEDETGDTVCSDAVCLDCWLELPKCNLCNKPYCNRHADRIEWSYPNSSGFVCETCSAELEQRLASPS